MENLNLNLYKDLALNYLIRPPKTITENKPLFIFFHGIGSNERDLIGLAGLLPDNFTVISARSPYKMGPDSYAFYQVDYSSGTPVINPEQLEKSLKMIKEFIKQVVDKYGIDTDNIYLGGFSQGAIMSYAVGLANPENVKGIVAFSGRILNEIKPQIKANESLKKLKIFISHGIDDNVLHIHFAREAKIYLSSLGIEPDYNEFNGGHEIPQIILDKFKNFIDQQII